MNKPEIITILSDLYKITGFRISLHGPDFAEIAAFPESHHPLCSAINGNETEHAICLECDRQACLTTQRSKETYIYKCRYGLCEAVSPLYNFGTLAGFLMMGQIAESEKDAKDAAKLAAAKLGDESICELYSRVPVVKPDMISSFVKIMTVCAEYITLSNALPSAKPTVAETAKRYIAEHISDKISINDICLRVGCSKSTLLTAFKKSYGITVNEFITESRLEQAADMLTSTSKTINEISDETGFSDQSYFSKVFSSRYRVPPSEYRARVTLGDKSESKKERKE